MKRIFVFISLLFINAVGFSLQTTSQPPSPPNIKIEDTYFTVADTTPLKKLALIGSKSYGYRATDLKVDSNLAQLLRLRVSQINHCAYCLNVHHQAARDLKIQQVKIDSLDAWWNTDLYTDAEKAALTYTESLTRLDNDDISKNFPQYHEQLVKYYSEEQIVEITGIVINMNIWTRLKLAEGAKPVAH